MKFSLKQNSLVFIISILFFIGCKNDNEKQFTTYCNPIDLNYRFCLEGESMREAADPTTVFFKGSYYLFASKSGGYWKSEDLSNWNFIQSTTLPTEEYAPTAININDTLYFLASSTIKSTIYMNSNPEIDNWVVAKDSLEVAVWDPAFFIDDDNKLYLYWGCSNKDPIYGVELNYDFTFKGDKKNLIYPNPENYGWEIRGDYNTRTDVSPWLEGAWMNKVNDKYYLQYSAPGTLEKSYCDAVYESDSPLGPFTVALHNPFAYKPEGFACGAGHGSTLYDEYNNLWHFGTVAIAVKQKFERRVSMFPSFVDQDGIMYSSSKYGDYPIIIPERKVENFDDIFPGWMLLSYNKKTNVSSQIIDHGKEFLNDEEIRSYWAAKSSGSEWAMVDLEKEYNVKALQVNFAEHNSKLHGINKDKFHRYIVETSNNNKDWDIIIDKSQNNSDNTHNYFQLEKDIVARYVRVKNITCPSGNFAISGLRVFGLGKYEKPDKINNLKAERNKGNSRSISLSWDKSEHATGYNISYGIDPKKLYQNYIVYDKEEIQINSLNSGIEYYFTIEAFNENGITKSAIITKAE